MSEPARAVIRGASAPSRGDQAYRVYLLVLAALVYGAPMAIGGAQALAPDAAWTRLVDHPMLCGLAAATNLALLAGVRLGQVLGPVRPRAGFVSFVVASTVDRAHTLGPDWRRALIACAVPLVLLTADVVSSRVVAGAWSWWWLAPVVGAALVGAIGAGAALRGQTGAARRTLTGGLLACTAAAGVATVLPTPVLLLAGPGGWWALTASPAWTPVALVLLAVAAAWLARGGPQLRSLRSHDLLAQAARATGLGQGLTLGNSHVMSRALAGTVTRGRALRLRDQPAGSIARRDRLGLRRTPEATVTGIGLLAMGAVMGSLVVAHSWPLLPATLACALAYAGTHLLSGGLHEHVSHASRDSWHAIPYRAAAAQHAWTPFLVGAVVWWVVALALTPVGAITATTWGPLVLAVIACGSVAAAHQGDLPPMPTGPVSPEVGDTGAMMRFAWVAGIPLTTIAFGGGVLALAWSPLAAGAVGIVGLLVTAAMATAALDRATAR